MELLNDVIIQCEECGNIIVIKKEYLDTEISSYERQMGPEIAYDIYEECDCEKCGNNIKYRISGYEYPAGVSIMKIMKYMVDDFLRNLTWGLCMKWNLMKKV